MDGRSPLSQPGHSTSQRHLRLHGLDFRVCAPDPANPVSKPAKLYVVNVLLFSSIATSSYVTLSSADTSTVSVVSLRCDRLQRTTTYIVKRCSSSELDSPSAYKSCNRSNRKLRYETAVTSINICHLAGTPSTSKGIKSISGLGNVGRPFGSGFHAVTLPTVLPCYHGVSWWDRRLPYRIQQRTVI